MSKTMPPDARPESAKSRDQKPSDATMQALCNECGNVRTAKAIYFGSDGRYDRKVKCDACGRATTHFPVPMESRSDRRERRNAEVNEQARLAVQFQESGDARPAGHQIRAG